MMVVGAIGLLACSEKQKPLPPAVDDAGVSSLQSSDPAVRGKPEDVLKAFEKLDWSVGLSRPLMLLEYTPTTGHPPFCNNGAELLKELSTRVGADTASKCSVQSSALADEVEVRCPIEVPGFCMYVYRATLWTELDRANEKKYRLLATAWLNQTVCADNNAGKIVKPDPNFLFHIQIGKSFRSLLDQCRQGTPPP
jgi:hypothetical protein